MTSLLLSLFIADETELLTERKMVKGKRLHKLQHRGDTSLSMLLMHTQYSTHGGGS